MLKEAGKKYAVATNRSTLDAIVKRELLEILRKSEQGHEPTADDTVHWFYNMPFPGVRYFRYPSEPAA